MQYVESFLIILPIAFFIRTYFYGLYQVPTGSMETTMLVGERFFADKLTVLFWPPKQGDIISFNDPNFEYSDNKFMEYFQRYVWGPSNWTKRVIACPGDHLKGVMENGKPVVYLKKKGQVDFIKLEEPYLNQYPIIAEYLPNCWPRPWTYFSYDPAKTFAEQPFYRLYDDRIQLAKTLLARIDEPSILYPQTASYNNYGRNVDVYDIELNDNEYWVMGDNRLGSYDSRFWGTTGKPLNGKLIHGKIVLRLWSIDSEESWWILDLVKNPIDFWKRVRWNRFFQVLY